MKVFPDFQEEVLKMDERLSVEVNPNYPKLANIKLGGKDVCPIPSGEIYEETDPTYTITFPNGFVSKHRSRPEAIARINSILEMIKTKEGHEDFFGI